MEHRLPIAARWSLYALGVVEGHRVRRPRDPVAAWLLRRHPKLLPTFAAPSILSMIRARTTLIDALIGLEVARVAPQQLTYWGLGSAFDARWYRMKAVLAGHLRAHHEVDEPDVVAFKDRVLATSSFAGHWGSVHREGVGESQWTVPPHKGPLLVNLEGVSTRVGVEGTRALLRRLRHDAPTATVLLDLPGILQPKVQSGRAAAVSSTRSRWLGAAATGAAAISTRDLYHLGYIPIDDEWSAARPELRTPSGIAICSGVEAIRVLRLRPRED